MLQEQSGRAASPGRLPQDTHPVRPSQGGRGEIQGGSDGLRHS